MNINNWPRENSVLRAYLLDLFTSLKKFSWNLVTGCYKALRHCMGHVNVVMLEYARLERRVLPEITCSNTRGEICATFVKSAFY